jgi:hypothetical protein
MEEATEEAAEAAARAEATDAGDAPHRAAPRPGALLEPARDGTGLATIYGALDRLVDLYQLRDAAVVVDVPGFGRQVLHAGRRPLHRDERQLREAPPGLYLDPPLPDPVLDELMVGLASLGLRFDARTAARP